MDTIVTPKNDDEILLKLTKSIGGEASKCENGFSSLTIPVKKMDQDSQSIISVAEYVDDHHIRVPLDYHKMIVEGWNQQVIGSLVQSCGMVIFKDPNVQKYTKCTSCFFITSIDQLNTRTLLFSYETNKINRIASFKWDSHHDSRFLTADSETLDFLYMFASQVHEQMFRIGWAAITAVPQASPRNYKPVENSTVSEWILRNRDNRNSDR